MLFFSNYLFRYFSTEYLASYRSLTATYYPEYAASAHAAAGYIGNGYFDVASPRSLTSIPYDAASQFNRYFESDKVDCKYNPNSAESPKPEFQQQLAPPHTPQQQQQPNSGKEGSTNLEVVKTEQPEINNVIHATSFGGLAVAGTGVAGGADEVVVDLQHFVSTTAPPPPSVVATTATATQMILVRSRCSLKNC